MRAIVVDTGEDETVGGLTLTERCRRALAASGASDIHVVSEDGGDLDPTSRGELRLVSPSHAVVPAATYARMLCHDRPGEAAAEGRRTGIRVVDGTVTHDRAALPAVEVGGWCVDARTARGRRRALDLLLQDCRKEGDGLVARYLNRPVSLRVTRRLAPLGISPSQVTVATFAIAVAGAWAASRGGYRPTVAGAALMHLSSVLDGVDGELSRLRHEQTHLGAWLDTIADDVSNVAFWAGLAAGADRPTSRASGWIAASANALAAVEGWAQLSAMGSGDLADLLGAASRHRLVRLFEVVLKQDFFLLLALGLALADRLHDALPFVTAGALVTLGSRTARWLR